MREVHSIFNHTLAPITPGPSSSNTCGPARIALFANRIFGGIPQKAVIEYSSTGSFPTTLFGMKSDYSFVNGLLGKDQNAPDYKQCYACAKEAGLEVSFRAVDDLTIGGYEAARLRLSGGGRNMVIVGESLGGGSFLMHSIDGIPIESHGAYYEVFVLLDTDAAPVRAAVEAAAESLLPQGSQTVWTADGGRAILQIKLAAAPEPALEKTLAAQDHVCFVRTVEPVVPEVIAPAAVPPFDTAAGLIAWCEDNHGTPAQAAVAYETAVSGWTEAQVYAYAQELLAIMKTGIEAGTQTDFSFPGILDQKGPAVQRYMREGHLPALGFLDEAIPAALGVMEYSNASGKIVCVPTGGSSGIVPGLLIPAARSMDKTEKELADALLCAGLIGVILMIEGNNFSGGMTGCQAEIGCGTAMAAAGLAALCGGTAKQVCDAACMGLQTTYGLVCDPVCGFVQVPCLARNMTAVSSAATCAKAVLAGFDVLVPLDEMIGPFIEGGRTIMTTLGIGKSGCCTTPTARRLKEARAAGEQQG